MYYILQCIILFLLFVSSIWISLRSYQSTKKSWLSLRILTSPCLSSEECVIFNVSYYSNGKIIFYGINNTAYIGKKIFYLQTNRINAIDEFIQTHSFKSDFESIKILFFIQLSYNNNEIYFWKNNSISYTILTSLLTIDRLSSYKRWSILLRTAYILSNIEQKKQKLKRSIETYIKSTSLIIPTTKIPYITNDKNYKIPFVQSIKIPNIIIIKYNDDLCFSSQITLSKFDLIDACLSTNDIINDNEFYPLRNQFIWFNELIDSQVTISSNESLFTTQYETTGPQFNLTSTSAIELTTLSPPELAAQKAVNELDVIRDQLTGPDAPKITEAQELINAIPSNSTIKELLQKRLDAIKASFTKTTGSFNNTAEVVTSISPSNETLYTTLSSTNTTFLTTPIPSNETLYTTVSSANTTFFATPTSSNEMLYTTISSTNTTFLATLTPSSETLHTTTVEAEFPTKLWPIESITNVILTTMDDINRISNNEEITDISTSSSTYDNNIVLTTTTTQTDTTTTSLENQLKSSVSSKIVQSSLPKNTQPSILPVESESSSQTPVNIDTPRTEKTPVRRVIVVRNTNNPQLTQKPIDLGDFGRSDSSNIPPVITNGHTSIYVIRRSIVPSEPPKSVD